MDCGRAVVYDQPKLHGLYVGAENDIFDRTSPALLVQLRIDQSTHLQNRPRAFFDAVSAACSFFQVRLRALSLRE